MNIKTIIGQVLREEYKMTETSYLGWIVPRIFYDDLKKMGVKLWDERNDIIEVVEIHLDNKDVVFELITQDGNLYEFDPNIPGTFESNYKFKIKDLPKSLKHFIIRRLEDEWINYLI